jgi:putative ABC transport system permease protein
MTTVAELMDALFPAGHAVRREGDVLAGAGRAASGEVAVVDQVMAERMKIGVGDELTLLHPDRPLKVRVVGVVHKPALLAMHMHTIYLPLETMQRYVGRDQQVSRIFVDLQSGADEEAFAAQWGPKLEKMEPVLRLRQAGQRQREMQKNMAGVQFISYMGGTVAMLAATFIVFTTLSMGVAERTRSLAMLRAVGADRAQIGQLVVMEGGILAAFGALVGVPLGILWTHLLAWFHETLFSAGVVISHGGVAYAAAGMIAAAIVASFMPAWIAMRIKPLDAMAPLGQPTQPRKMLLAAGLGLLLLAVDPLIVPHVTEQFDDSALSTGLGVFNFFGMSASVVAPFVTGLLQDALGSQVFGFYIAATLLFVSSTLFRLVNPKTQP